MKYALLIVSTVFLCFVACQNEPIFELQEGDLLFQDGDCGDFCAAIEAVTDGVNDWEFSHVGLVIILSYIFLLV